MREVQELFCSRKPLSYPGSARVKCGLQALTFFRLSCDCSRIAEHTCTEAICWLLDNNNCEYEDINWTIPVKKAKDAISHHVQLGWMLSMSVVKSVLPTLKQILDMYTNNVLQCLHPIACKTKWMMWRKSRPCSIWYHWSNKHCVCWLQIQELKHSLVIMLASNVLEC